MEIKDAEPVSSIQTPPPPPAAETERPAEPESPPEAPPLPEDSATILDLYA